MKTPGEYKASIKELKFNAYIFGEKVDVPSEHPLVKPSLNAVAMTYSVANDGKYQEISTTKSHLTGERVNRFTNIHHSKEDLISKVKLLRLLGQKTGTCFQRCVGMDALNALYSTTYEIDQASQTNYHTRFKNFLKYVQEKDLVCDGAMTDPKGDRSKSPSMQKDPDLFLHVIKENTEGIFVKGAKLHQTGALNSHETIVMPTISMKKEDADYAVAFAIPADSEGITYILGRQASDTRRMEEGNIDAGNSLFGGQECMVIFENVFVPWERVFMYREYEFAGMLVERFAAFHRQSYGGCKVGVGDVLIGAVSNVLDYHGINNASHAKDKVVEMIHLNETMYCCGMACSQEGKPTVSGSYIVDLMLANVCKLNVTRCPYEIARIAEDLAGGLMVTLPPEAELQNPAISEYIHKYLNTSENVSTETRIKMLRLIENLTMGSGAVAYRTESMHGAGSPQAMKVMINRQANIDEKKEFAKKIARVSESE